MTVFLLSHVTGIKGPADFLEDYLLEKGYTTFHLKHPLDSYKNAETRFSKNEKSLNVFKRSNYSLLNYFIDFFLSVRTIHAYTFDTFIGANNFDTIAGIFVRKILHKKVKKIIYFGSDFSEERFHNKILDLLYITIEKIVLKSADLVVSNTHRAEAARKKLGLQPEKSSVIPNGVVLTNPIFSKKIIDKHAFIYVGNVTKEHGIVNFIELLSPLISKLVVIGQGDDWEWLQALIKDKKIPATCFYKKEHEFVINYLKKFGGFGLAPYNTSSKWTYYASPLKVNEYIACGVPVIVSDVVEIAEEVEKENLGIVYHEVDFREIEKKITGFDTKDFPTRAKKFYETHNYNYLYKKLILKNLVS